MVSTAGHRRRNSTDALQAWTARLKPRFKADHPRHSGRYDTYVNYVAFLMAGAVEHRWSEDVDATGRPPFAPLKHADTFLPDLQRKIRAFRESRFIDGLGSPELLRHSYDLLTFLGERVPHADLEHYLTVARIYVRHNEDECLAS